MRRPLTVPDSSRRPGLPAAGVVSLPAERQRVEIALERLSSDLKTLRVDYERFFSGALRTPPEDLRQRIALELRELRAANPPGVADNFRLGSLEAQFNSYHEVYGRRLREAEEGRGIRTRERPPAPPRHDPAAGIVVGARLDQESRDGIEALFDGLYRQANRPPAADLETFHAYIAQQLAAIRQKTGCTEVQFRIATEDGQLKLKAKPLPRTASTAGVAALD